MSNEGWFEVITETSTLRQGDLVDEVPVVRADTLKVWPPQDGAELPVNQSGSPSMPELPSRTLQCVAHTGV